MVRVCYYLSGDIKGGGIMKKVTNGNIGTEGSLKFVIFPVTSFLNGLSGFQFIY